MNEKLEALRALIEKEQRECYEKFLHDGPYKEQLVSKASNCRIVPGKKYTKIDIGDSGKYMVVNDTGDIFGIKGYGVIHKEHNYGNIDTINDWYWGDYTAVKKNGKGIS